MVPEILGTIAAGALAPINYQGVTSQGGPLKLQYNGHKGIDFKVPTGVSVVAAAAGVVDIAGGSNANVNGYHIRINHSPDQPYKTWYLHLQAGLLLAACRTCLQS